MTADDRRAFAALPALFAAVMLAGGTPALSLQVSLCSGGTAELPQKNPGKTCDQACHAGCQRRKGRY